MRPPNVVQSADGLVLFPADPVGLTERQRRLLPKRDCGSPGGMLLRPCPAAVPIASVLSGAELVAHLDQLGEIAARAEAADPRTGRTVCWACGRTARKAAPHWWVRDGWVRRVIPQAGKHRVVEVYCGPCFARWGWPEGGAE
jgi:hypothetical protein